jgi:hypothetical protein
MQIKDLNPNPMNPRRMSVKKKAMLRASIDEYGDLSGVGYNRRTKRLFAGHQRVSVLPPDTVVKIVTRYEKPNAFMTVAEGYIDYKGEHIKYREVDADETWEAGAMLAANKHSGEWDKDLLRVVMSDTKLNLPVIGFEELEIKELGLDLPKFDAAAFNDGIRDGFDPERQESRGGFDPDADEAYVASTKETQERIPTEGEKLNAFEGVKEQTEVLGKRYVIIIDCKDGVVKESLKEKIRAEVEMAGAKFF